MLPIQRDGGVPRGVAWVELNQPGVEVNRLLDDDLVVTDVTVATISTSVPGGAR